MARTMGMHSQNMRNYVDHRSTNASAESFNAKIKAFRVKYRGVTNINYLFFLESKIFLLNAKTSLHFLVPKVFKIKLLYLTNEPNKL